MRQEIGMRALASRQEAAQPLLSGGALPLPLEMPQPGEQSRQYLQVRKLIENLVKELHCYNLIMRRAHLARSQRAKHSGSSTEKQHTHPCGPGE